MPRSFTDGIVKWNQRRYGVTINPDQMLVTTGVHPALIAAIKAFSPTGSKVLVQTPTYNGFFGDIRVAGCLAEESPLKLANGRYSMDFDDLERRIGHDTHSLILCNPQNPTGNCWSREDLMRVGEICTRRRVVVFADEIHCDFVTRGHKYHALRFAGEQRHRHEQPDLQGGEQVVRSGGDAGVFVGSGPIG